MADGPGVDRRAAAAVVAAGLLLLVPGSRTLPLVDRDEPRFAQATVEMIDRGEWVIPYFNGEYRFDKPALAYWLMRGGYALLGRNELGARAHSIAGALALALAVLAIGTRWFSPRTGLLAALGLLASLQVLVHGRSAVADVPMVLAVTLAQAAAWELLRDGGPRAPWRWFALLYGALAAGFLAKGPIAWIVPALTLALHRWVFGRRPLPWRRLRAGWGLLVVLALLAPWGVPALVRTGGEFWRVGVGRHVVERGFQAFSGRPFVPFYYLPAALFSLFPWIAFAGWAAAAARRGWSPLQAWLVSWAAAPYLVFSLYSTQLPHYVLPAFPALFLLLARGAEPGVAPGRWGRAWLAAFAGLAASAVVLLALAGLAVGPASRVAALRPVLLGAAAMAVGLAALLPLYRRPRAAGFAAAAVVVALGMRALAAGLRAATPAVLLAPRFAAMPDGAAFLCAGFREPSLVYYAGRTWEVAGSAAELARRVPRDRPWLAVLAEEEWPLDGLARRRLGAWLGRDLPARRRDHRAANDALELPGAGPAEFVEGLNVARSQWVRLRVVRGGPAASAPGGAP